MFARHRFVPGTLIDVCTFVFPFPFADGKRLLESTIGKANCRKRRRGSIKYSMDASDGRRRRKYISTPRASRNVDDDDDRTDARTDERTNGRPDRSSADGWIVERTYVLTDERHFTTSLLRGWTEQDDATRRQAKRRSPGRRTDGPTGKQTTSQVGMSGRASERVSEQAFQQLGIAAGRRAGDRRPPI